MSSGTSLGFHRRTNQDQSGDKAAAAQFDRIILSLLERVANTPERPRWNSDSFFRRFPR